MPAAQALRNDKVPPWWDKLLIRCRDFCEEYKGAKKLREKFSGLMSDRELTLLCWNEYLGERRFFYPLFDDSLIDWLLAEVHGTQEDYPSLLHCVIERSIFHAQPMPERSSKEVSQDLFLALAQRVMAEAALKQGPMGLREFLPGKSRPGRGVFDIGPHGGYPNMIDIGLREFLLTGWTGIGVKSSRTQMPSSSCPEKLWLEISDLGLIHDFLSVRTTVDNQAVIHVMHAWCAWISGCWNQNTINSLFPEHLVERYAGRPLEPSEYRFKNDRFIRFCEDFNKVITDKLAEIISKQDWKSLRKMFRYYDGEVSFEIMLGIAEKLSDKERLDGYQSFLHVNTLPKDGDLKKYQQRIKSLPQTTLRRLAICTGLASPMILDAIVDKQFRMLAQCILGTFSEPLVVDDDDHLISAIGDNPWYPGRTPSGVTNLNPLFEAIASSPPQVWKEAIRDADQARSLKGISKSFLELLSSSAKAQKDEFIQSSLFDFPAIARLTHRVPSGPEKWLEQRQACLDGLAEFLDDNDSHWLNTITLTGVKNTRIAARLYAESGGIESWQNAALEMAEHLCFADPFPCGTYTIRQVASMPRGVIICKGKALNPLKSIPAELFKNKESMRMLHRCRLFHLLYRTITRDAVDEWIESGSTPTEGYLKKFKEIFGGHPLAMLTGELEKSPDIMECDSLRESIIGAIGEERLVNAVSGHKGVCQAKGVVIERLQSYDWTCEYSPCGGNHLIIREFRKCGLEVRMDPISEPPDHVRFNPKKACNFAVYSGKSRPNAIARADMDMVKRISQRLAYEIGMATT